MGQEQSRKELQLSSPSSFKNNYKYQIPLDNFKQFQYQKNHMISSITANSKLTIFQKTQQIPANIGNLIAINTQLVYKQKKNTDNQAIEGIVKYYQIRKKLNQDHQIEDNIIKLFSFQSQNNKTKQKIYPETINKDNKCQNEKKKQNKLNSMCSFDLFNSRQSFQKTKSIIDRKGCYQFKFLYEFYLNNLQKQIQLRASSNSYFLQKQIWSLLWCCISVAFKMINLGLKEPMLSPSCIFISEQSLIKVGQWEFSSYYVHNKHSQESDFQQQGETILNLNLQQQQIHCDSSDNKNILMKYYWAPQGIIQMQKVISLGQLTKTLKLQKKNSQMFSLGMTVIQMCTLASHYQKSTYSEKQLTNIINKSISERQKSGQPLSNEMITFIKKMLTWDSQDRITYEEALQYIQNYFSQHNQIFEQEDADMQKSLNLKNTNQFQSMFTQQSINCCNDKIVIKEDQNNDEELYEQKISIGTTHLNLNGSGLVTQGEGDTFLPEEYEPELVTSNQIYSCMETMFPLAPDFADFQNFNDVGLQQTYENYRYDEDQFQFLRQSKQEIQFEVNEPNNYFNIEEGLSVSDRNNTKKQTQQHFAEQQQNQNKILTENKSLRNIKSYYEELQKVDNIDAMKLNIWSKNENNLNKQRKNANSFYEDNQEQSYYSNSFQNTFNKKKQNFASKQSDYQNNFQIKIATSPSVVASQEYSSIPTNKQSLFTDPILMAMIKQYSSRKEINEQPKNTPKQQKKPKYPQKQTFAVQQKKSSRSNNANQVNFVKQEFSRGFYQGSKKGGMRNGYGTFLYNEGGKYSGYWFDNQMEGHGTLYYPDGRIAYQGQWHCDSLHGKGVLHNQRPANINQEYDYSSFNQCESEQCWVYYDGWFLEDQKSGFGQLLLSNGQKYVGQFKNDMVHGKGNFYVLSGEVISGYWQNNELVELVNQK